MEFKELEIKGAWIATSSKFTDQRGYFREWFKESEIEKVIGRRFNVQQANISSSHKGVLRGIHYSIADQGQGKWITCISGSIWDVVVDIRPSSPTFRKWIGIDLNSQGGDALYVSEGLGHGFIALEDNTTVSYLLTSVYLPLMEFEINPFDPDLGITWPLKKQILSQRDKMAPTLQAQFVNGKLSS